MLQQCCPCCAGVVEPLLSLLSLPGRHSKMRVYYLSWLRNKILKGEEQYAEGQKSRHGYTTVGNLEKCVHFRIGESRCLLGSALWQQSPCALWFVCPVLLVVQHEKMKFLVIATKNNTIEIYAWAQKPYSKFMLFKQFHVDQTPQLVGMVCDSANRQKALYASSVGFHSIDLDTEVNRPIYTPTPVSPTTTCRGVATLTSTRLHPTPRVAWCSPTPS